MGKINFQGFSGYVTQIEDFLTSQENGEAGCFKKYTLENEAGMIVHFIVSPKTYFAGGEIISVGDRVTGYYDADVPVILIYPPQYGALIMIKESPFEQYFAGYFDRGLRSDDGRLQLHLAPGTPVLLTNGQPLMHHPGNRNLLVKYSAATKSIPAQTMPHEIIVICRSSQNVRSASHQRPD